MIKLSTKVNKNCLATLILCFNDDLKKLANTKQFTENITKKINQTIDFKQFEANSSETFPIIDNKHIYLLVGLGKSKEATFSSVALCTKNVLKTSLLKNHKSIQLIPIEKASESVNSIIEGISVGLYVWDKYKTDKKDEKKTFEIILDSKKDLSTLTTILENVNFARDLINDNADLITATYFEEIIKKITKGRKNITIEVLDKKKLEKNGLNLHLAVNSASSKEPRLIIVKYTGDAKSKDYCAIIGKGITFDSGGLNLKPSGYLETMRSDMSGAACIVGTLKNAIDLKIKKNLLFVCTLAENAIGSKSFKPGDVIKSYSGKNVEIGNTDAEGRLVLADAISYTKKNYHPKTIIDVATLTGACVVALGYDYTGLISNNDSLAEKLINCGIETDDKLWRLPSYPELKDAIKSDYADIKNIGLSKGAAGTLTAAEFLRQFADPTPWAHLDIAGTAFVESSSKRYFSYGATGAGIKTLTQYLLKY